jgi:ABC-type branched-subunit amino acid transport system substrate-binding protein
VRAAALVASVAALAGCGGEEGHGRELVPGRVTVGVVAGEPPVAKGVRVEVNRINNAGGIGGALTVELVSGSAQRLVARGVRLIVLPCRLGLAAAARAASDGGAIAVAPCDDGVLPERLPGVYPTGLSPEAQAAALTEQLGGEARRVLPARTPRGARVHALLRLGSEGEGIASPDAPEGVEPPPDAPEGTVFATYGFPDPGSRVDEFAERFKAVFGGRPGSILAALGSDSASVLAYAVELAQSTRPEHVAESFEEGFEVRGVLGEVVFPGGTHRPEVAAAIVRLERGKLRTVATR